MPANSTASAPASEDRLRATAERLPRPVRFLVVGGLGLITDIGCFTLILQYGVPPLLARVVSLAVATLVTWRLNRALTFDASGRRQNREAARYVTVTAVAQGTSYLVFALLTLTVLAALPQLAIIAGAAAGALLSYNGHRLFAFARTRHKPSPSSTTSSCREIGIR
ncbi:MAG: GtrA family protein [Xanthobacteraceae bacterium]|nr:GtrA family protein [Xanthobacteraceae bacterium]